MPTATSMNFPPESGFTPRKEFIREQKHTLNSFSLLAISGFNLIRLYSFPVPVVTALRRLLEKRELLNDSREVPNENFYEFSLQGKPWTNSKSVTTEKLLIDIIAAIYHCGYTYLSTLDYGREQDDRIVVAFSKPALASSSRSGTPLTSSSTPEGSGSSLSDKLKTKRTLFALSFASATVMRVIAPPLHLTPGILQAVRASWPRGVVSERKVGENSFEFKLKGYKWFQQDTFAIDSLHQILSLLSSLDAQSFPLLASISLTRRSRVKDLWIFTDSSTSSIDDLTLLDSPVPSNCNYSQADHKRQVCSPEPLPHQSTAQVSQMQHRRIATEPILSSTHLQATRHVRAATEDGRPLHTPSKPNKYPVDQSGSPASPFRAPDNLAGPVRRPPRAQVPVSVLDQENLGNEVVRANLPSIISSNVENMTGVGASRYTPDKFYSTSPLGPDATKNTISLVAPVPISPRPRAATSLTNRGPLRPVSTRAKTPPLLVSNIPSASASPCRSSTLRSAVATPPLLSPEAFRDSAFSSNSEASCEIPIKWTGQGEQDPNLDHYQDRSQRSKRSIDPPGSTRPGGWQPTPVEEQDEEDNGGSTGPTSETVSSPEMPIHEVESRIKSPELNLPDTRLRKSEAALVDMIKSSPPSVPQQDKGKRKESQGSGASGGQGWVLVNVESPSSPPPSDPKYSEEHVVPRSSEPLSPTGKNARNGVQPTAEQAPTSPAAKAIVIIDAVQSRKKSNGRSTALKKGLFSLGKKQLKQTSRQAESDRSPPGDEEEGRNVNPSHSTFRDKFRLTGTPEAPRNQDKRRSLD